jgi:hypothetical protein
VFSHPRVDLLSRPRFPNRILLLAGEFSIHFTIDASAASWIMAAQLNSAVNLYKQLC